MAKLSSIKKNEKRAKAAANKFEARRKLKEIIMNKNVDFSSRIDAVHRLAEKPRNAVRNRVRNRCQLTGRPHGFYRKFKLSRIALRELGSQGLIPGLVKSSW